MGDQADSPDELLAIVFAKYSNQSSRRTGSENHAIGLTQWLRLLKEANVLTKSRATAHPQTGITHTDAEMLHLRTAGRGAKTLRFDQFCFALETVAKWMYDKSPKEEAFAWLAEELCQLAGGRTSAQLPSKTETAALDREQALSSFAPASKALRAIYMHYAVRGLPRDKLLDRRSFGAFAQEYGIIPLMSEAASAQLFTQCADCKGGTASFAAFMQCLTLLCKPMFGDEAEQPRTMLEHLAAANACEVLQRKLHGTPSAQALHMMRQTHVTNLPAPLLAPGLQPIGGEAAEMLEPDELAAVTRLFQKYRENDGRINLGGVGRFARDAKILEESVCGQEITMIHLDRAFGIEAARGGLAKGSITTVDQFARVLLHLSIIKFPDANDEMSALGFMLRAHVLPFALPQAPEQAADLLEGFFDAEVIELVDLVSDELEVLYRQTKGPAGITQSLWLGFVRKFGLLSLTSQRELRQIFASQCGQGLLDFEGFVNAVCCVAIVSAGKAEHTAASSGVDKIRALVNLIESSLEFEKLGIRPAATHAATVNKSKPPVTRGAPGSSRTRLTPGWH